MHFCWDFYLVLLCGYGGEIGGVLKVIFFETVAILPAWGCSLCCIMWYVKGFAAVDGLKSF